jgi:hypothetical protein
MKKGLLVAVVSLLACAGAVRADGEPTACECTWVELGFTEWWFDSMKAPALVSTGPASSVAQFGNGILGQTGTTVLLGDGKINDVPHEGGQATVGWWLTCDHSLALTGGFFGAAQRTRTDTFNSDVKGNPLVSRPVTDALSGQQTTLFVSSPDAFGSAGLSVETQSYLLSADANFMFVTSLWENPFMNLVLGFRWLELREQMTFNQSSMVLQNGIAFFDGSAVSAGNRMGVSDSIRTRNDFFGPQVGVRTGASWGGFVFNVNCKLAVGIMREGVSADGSSSLTPLLGPSSTVPGGLLVQPGRIGEQTQDRFAVVPIIETALTYHIDDTWAIMIGYNILYASEVARPGSQINAVVDRTQLPTSQVFSPTTATVGTSTPSGIHTDSFWAQGVSIGVAWSY